MVVEAISFKQVTNTDNTNVGNNEAVNNNVKSDLVRNPSDDSFEKKNESDNKETERPKKKHRIRNACLGLLSAIVLTYGGMVLSRKLSKPSLEEVQKCFKEIFEKDLSNEQIKELINKYKEICKNGSTDDFTKGMIEQLKKDYGIEQVKTELNVIKLADNKISTAMNHTETGNASPLAKINIMPRTSRDSIIRSIQGDTFSTGFHELKHIKQFADAYRANPNKFAEVLFRHNIKQEEFDKILKDEIKKYNERILKQATDLHNGEESIINEIYQNFQTMPEYKGVSKNEIKQLFKNEKIEDLVVKLKEKDGYKTEEDLNNFWKKELEDSFIQSYKKMLDSRYGSLEAYKEGTEEYKKGMEYIEAFDKYPNPNKDYDAYRQNLLEKEAWHVGDLAKKIYKYTSSIWKL